MKKTIYNGYELQQEFISFNRDYFSPLGYDVLFAYLEELEQCSCEDYELDVIELCGMFTEYKDIEEAFTDYGMESIEELEENTTVLQVTDYKNDVISYIVEAF